MKGIKTLLVPQHLWVGSAIILGFVSLICASCTTESNQPQKDIKINFDTESIFYFKDFDYKNLKGIDPITGIDFRKLEEETDLIEDTELRQLHYVKVLRSKDAKVVSVQSYRCGKPHGYWTYYDRKGGIYEIKFYYDGKQKQQLEYK